MMGNMWAKYRSKMRNSTKYYENQLVKSLARRLLRYAQATHSSEQENIMKAVDRIDMYDLATAFIVFGMMLGLLLK